MKRDPAGKNFKSWVLLVLGVLLAAHTSPGIHYDTGATLIVVALVFSLLNLFLKPLLIFFALPFVVFTLGLGIWIINAFLFMVVGRLVEGFVVESFWAALWGAFIVSMTSLLANLFFYGKVLGQKGKIHISINRTNFGQTSAKRDSKTISDTSSDRDDVIDI